MTFNAEAIDVPTFCQKFSIPPSSAYAMLSRGEIPSLRLSRRRIRIPVDGLEKLVAAALTGAKGGQ